MIKRHVIAAAALAAFALLPALAAAQTGACPINPGIPANVGPNTTASSLALRQQFQAAIACFQNAVTMSIGAAAPNAPLSGQEWLDNSISPWQRFIWDGASWVFEGTVDPVNHVFTPAPGLNVQGPASSAAGDLPSFGNSAGNLLGDTGIQSSLVVTTTGTQTLSNKSVTTPPSADTSGAAINSQWVRSQGYAMGGTCPAHQWGNAWSSGALPSCAQPAAADISGGAASVVSEAALAASSIAQFPNGVVRLGNVSGDTAPPLLFWPQSGTCAANGMTNDGGSCANEASGNSFYAKFPPGGIDWREFGLTTSTTGDNHTALQYALQAGVNLNLWVWLCGVGTFYDTASVYYYPYQKAAWCPGTVLKKNFSGAAFVPASKIGDTYPVLGDNSHNGSLYYVEFDQPTIDLNYTAGTGILMVAQLYTKVVDPQIYNIADTGTWSWTDAEGTGTLPNAGIVLAGGNVDNVENVEISGGNIGDWNTHTTGPPYNYTNCTHFGGAGIVLTVPSQDTSGANPPNGNHIHNIGLNCNRIGLQNDYGSDNHFDLVDGSYSTIAGITLGTWQSYALLVGGSISSGGGDTICLTVAAATGLTGSPLTQCSPGSLSSDTLITLAGKFATAVNGNATLSGFGLTAANPSGTAVVVLSYYDTGTTAQANFTFSATGNTSLAAAHSAGRNYIVQPQLEGNEYYGVFLGPNAGGNILDLPGSYAGTATVIGANHGGGGGAQATGLIHMDTGTTNFGTYKNANFTTNINDIQPYLVDATSGAITATLNGNDNWGAEYKFVDLNSEFGVHPLTIALPSASWGTIHIAGGTSNLTLNANKESADLKNYQGNWVLLP